MSGEATMLSDTTWISHFFPSFTGRIVGPPQPAAIATRAMHAVLGAARHPPATPARSVPRPKVLSSGARADELTRAVELECEGRDLPAVGDGPQDLVGDDRKD